MAEDIEAKIAALLAEFFPEVRESALAMRKAHLATLPNWTAPAGTPAKFTADQIRAAAKEIADS